MQFSSAPREEKYFAPRRLGHTNLWSTDIERSMHFYRDVCGLTLEFSEPDLKAHFLGTGHTPHDLGMIEVTGGVDRYGRDGLLQIPGTVGLKPGLNHLAWELENEAHLIAVFREMEDAGVKYDMTVDHQVAHSLYMFDPDGNYNEFYCDTVKNWREVLQGDMDLLTSAWDPLTAEGFEEGRYDPDPELRVVESAAVQPKRLTHAVLVTSQLDSMVNYYTTIGGLRVVNKDGGAVYLSAGLPGYNYVLILIEGEATAYHHASFELQGDADVERSFLRLSERDIKPVRVVELPWKRSFFLRDPDGMLSEWYVNKPGMRDLTARGDVPLEYAV